MNPNALPKSATLQDFQNFGDDLNSTDYNDTLNAMQYMQGLRQPTGGLNRLPQVTVPMQEGGGMEEAMMQEQGMSIQPMNPEEQAMMMQQVEQQEPRESNPEVQALAQQVASYGRGGDKLLLHIRPDELQGLSSLLNVTINPTTGMPEAFINKIVKGAKRIVKGAAKGVKNVVKSDAFKTLAPIALAIAAPYAAAYMGFGGAAGAGLTLSQQVAAMGPGMFGFTTGLGSLTGNLLAGRSFKDSAKAGLISGVTAGTFRGVSNKMAGKTFMGDPVQPDTIVASNTNSELVSQGGAPTSFKGGYQPPSTTNIASGTPPAGTDFYGGEVGGTSTNIPTASQDIIQKYPTTQTLNVSPPVDGPIVEGGFKGTGQEFLTGTTDTTPIAGGFVPTVDPVSTMPDPYAPNLFKRTVSKLGEYTPESVKEIGSAIGQDFNPTTKSGLINIATKGVAGDLGSSVVSMQEQNEDARRRQEEEDEALRREGYTVEYPDGYNSQRVVYDMTGVIPIRTIDEILNRALGGGRYQYRGRTVYEPTSPEDVVETAQGGLISMARGSEFSGMVPGQGGGMDDNVYMPIKEGPEQVGTLAVSPTEYVVDSYTMAALGDGNPAEGARVMDKTIKQIREKAFGNTKQPNEIDGLAALKPMVQGV